MESVGGAGRSGDRRRQRHRRRAGPPVRGRGRPGGGQRHRRRGGGRGGRLVRRRPPCPATRPARTGVAALVGAARDVLGEIDLFCANAGIGRAAARRPPRRTGTPRGRSTSWRTSGPRGCCSGPWLERGRGHLICTVSAAGLLTMLGLGAVLGDQARRAGASPSGWRPPTRTAASPCRRSARRGCAPRCWTAAGPAGRGAARRDPRSRPEEVADAVIEGIADGRFLILPHPEVAGHVRGPGR